MNTAINTYQRQAIINASPEELVSILFDMAIQASYRKDAEKLQGVLNLLMKSLNFDYDLAKSLYGLYEYCQQITKEKKFEEVRELIDNIRDAWNQSVVKKHNSSGLNVNA